MPFARNFRAPTFTSSWFITKLGSDLIFKLSYSLIKIAIICKIAIYISSYIAI